jgi:hypothetical protein
MHAQRCFVLALMTSLALAPQAAAQSTQLRKGQDAFVLAAPVAAKVLEVAPLEAISVVKNAPFSADAVTEFTQLFGDGNRIERRYVASIARDGAGRTRREEEIALIGPLGATGPAPHLVTIVDPDAQLTYTLDEATRVAHRNAGVAGKLVSMPQAGQPVGVGLTATRQRKPIALPFAAALEVGTVVAGLGADAETVRVESLGMRTIEGVIAEGTRTTSTIPAGAIGNLLPIDVTSERWFSPELQMAVLITRRDPRAGETVYRLTNIVRAEQPPSLFTVPLDYEIRDGVLSETFRKLEVIRRK